jgi:uncharacterized repeat protein (TIGR03803 family)
MNFLQRGRYSLGIVAAVAILAGCGGSQPPIGVGGGMQQPTPVRGMVAPLRRARKPAVVYSFAGSPDGAEPYTGVIALTKRQAPRCPCLVGTTLKGGDSNNDGTVYSLTPGTKGAWTESVLYAFKGATTSDGSEPTGIWRPFDSTSPLFVTTLAGGTYGAGAVVELTPTSSGSWIEGVLYSFGPSPDGNSPYGPVVADTKGNLYGTTSIGGKGFGVVYRMQPKGSSYSESVLYSFEGGNDGGNPHAGLIIDKEGALYGTTVAGGSTGSGTVFKLTPKGSDYTESILYSFEGPPNDGAAPYGGLTAVGTLALAANGKVVGMSSSGGNRGYGIIYELTLSGSGAKESVLWNFGSVSGDGAYPYGNACTNEKGVIYGTTRAGGSGGSSGLGTFFTLTPSGSAYKESVYSFTGPNGANPYAGPSVDSKGNLYVTTASGGSKDEGAVVTNLGPDNVRKKHVCG